MITWTTLTDGLFGGIAGALGAFSAALVTIWWTRRADRRREEARSRAQEAAQRGEVISRLIGILKALETEVRWAPFLTGRAYSDLLQVSMLFYQYERREHPDVANWLLARQDDFGTQMQRWNRVWWLPRVRSRRLEKIGEHLGQTVAAINAWSVGDFSDEWFRDRSDGRV